MAQGTVQKNQAIASLFLGGLEIAFGLIILICSFVLKDKLGNASIALTPYWAGIPFFLPGIVGIVVGVTKNYCAMIGFMILNLFGVIISGIASIILFMFIGTWVAIVDELTQDCKMVGNSCRCVHNGKVYTYDVHSCDTLRTIVALLYSIIVFSVISTLVAFAASVVGCLAVCCSGSRTQGNTTVIVQQPMMMQPQPGMQPQPMMVAPQQQQQQQVIFQSTTPANADSQLPAYSEKQ